MMYFSLLVACIVVGGCAAPTKADGFKDVRDTLVALDGVISWAKAHHYLLIVDFLFSIRVAQGELEMLTARSVDMRVSDIDTRIQIIREKLDYLAEITFDNPAAANTEYYKKFLPMISQKYYISRQYSTRKRFPFTPRHEAAPVYNATFSETQSDSCMVEILGSKDVTKCQLSRSCFHQMTDDLSEDYQLTHQLLYFILAELHSCGKQLEKLARSNGTYVAKLVEKYAMKTYKRLPSVLDSGSYDLFLEMVMIGQMLNYVEFYHPRITQLLLLWHDSTGCYNEESQTPDTIKTQTNRIGRRLFAEEIVDESCSEHMTALALIVLSLTLQHQLRDMTRDNHSSWAGSTVIIVAVGAVVCLLLCFRKRTRRRSVLRYFSL